MVIGPRYELCAYLQLPDNGKPPFPCVFDVTRDRELVGRIRARLEPEIIPPLTPGLIYMEIAASHRLPEIDQAEIYRLFARVCVLLGEHQIALAVPAPLHGEKELERQLIADGFEPLKPGLIVRKPIPFELPEEVKGKTIEDVYDYEDPFRIPWNFAPRSRDVLEVVISNNADQPLLRNTLPAPRVLDLGCGYGKHATLLEDLGFETYGIDIVPAAIERCCRLVRFPERFVVGSATALPWQDGIFDLVIDVGCMNWVPKEHRNSVLTEVARVLAPGGIMLSRLFKDLLGLSSEEALTLFEKHFETSIWKWDPHEFNLLCRRA